jgi:hypothetical protein
MNQERAPQKEPIDQICQYCGEGSRATRKVITQDKGLEFVCDDHYQVLKGLHVIKSAEEILWEAEWRMENEHDEQLDFFKDTDDWEDGSLFGF